MRIHPSSLISSLHLKPPTVLTFAWLTLLASARLEQTSCFAHFQYSLLVLHKSLLFLILADEVGCVQMLLILWMFRISQGNGVLPNGTSRFSCKGKALYHFMGCSTFSEYTVVADISLCKVGWIFVFVHTFRPCAGCGEGPLFSLKLLHKNIDMKNTCRYTLYLLRSI